MCINNQGKMRPYWIKVDHTSNDWCFYEIKEGNLETGSKHTQREDDHAKMRTEIEAMQLQDKACQGL